MARRVEALRRAPGDGWLGGRVDPRLPRAPRGRRRADAHEPRPDGWPPARRARRRRARSCPRPAPCGRAGDRGRRGGVGREAVVRRGAPRAPRGGGAPRGDGGRATAWIRPATWGAPTRSSIACSMVGARERTHRDPGGRRSSRRRGARGRSRARAVELAREHARHVGPADGRAHPASARDPLRPPRPRRVADPAASLRHLGSRRRRPGAPRRAGRRSSACRRSVDRRPDRHVDRRQRAPSRRPPRRVQHVAAVRAAGGVGGARGDGARARAPAPSPTPW